MTPDYNQPAGGIRVIYRHVDILNDAGIAARVLHQRPGFRCTWFENESSVEDVRNAELGSRDILVIGERNVASLSMRSCGYSHVVFNQNIYNTLVGARGGIAQHLRDGPVPQALIAVSEYNRDFLANAFPEVPTIRVMLSIDDVFQLPVSPRENVITFMPRKGARDQADLVRLMIGSTGLPRGWAFEPVDGLSQEEVASRLQRSRIFVSFADREGFGLPAAEAMACGNYVVGSHGYGGSEYFDKRYCSPVGPWDVVGIARALTAALERDQSEPGWLDAKGLEAARAMASQYSKASEASSVVEAYSRLLK